MAKARASVFVGSSTEAQPIAQDFCTALYRYFVDSGFCLGLNPSNSVDLSSNCSGYMSESGAISRVNKVALQRCAKALSRRGSGKEQHASPLRTNFSRNKIPH